MDKLDPNVELFSLEGREIPTDVKARIEDMRNLAKDAGYPAGWQFSWCTERFVRHNPDTHFIEGSMDRQAWYALALIDGNDNTRQQMPELAMFGGMGPIVKYPETVPETKEMVKKLVESLKTGDITYIPGPVQQVRRIDLKAGDRFIVGFPKETADDVAELNAKRIVNWLRTKEVALFLPSDWSLAILSAPADNTEANITIERNKE